MVLGEGGEREKEEMGAMHGAGEWRKGEGEKEKREKERKRERKEGRS